MLTDAFMKALTACGGTVSVAGVSTLADALCDLVSGAESAVVVPPDLGGLCAQLAERGIDCRVASRDIGDGEPLETSLRRAGVAVTRALVGIARSGTVGVGPGGGNGGLLAVLAPRHIVLLREEDIVESLAEALRVVSRGFTALGGEAVFITGPSRTADIEMMSVIGVHGPSSLHVLVVRSEEA